MEQVKGTAATPHVDFTRATEVNAEVREAIADAFTYHDWTVAMIEAGDHVRKALAEAVAVIVANAPPCPDRSSAIRRLREARMDANSAITHAGKY